MKSWTWEKSIALLSAVIFVAMIVPHLCMPVGEACELKAIIASWSAGLIAVLTICMAAFSRPRLETVLACGIGVAALCYMDHINHGVYLEEKAAAEKATMQVTKAAVVTKQAPEAGGGFF